MSHASRCPSPNVPPSAGGEDLFVHQTAIISEGFRSLREGEPVEFYIENADDGRSKAVQVCSLGLDWKVAAGPHRSELLVHTTL